MRLSEDEFRAAVGLAGELGEMPPDPRARAARLLEGLCRLVGAREGSDQSTTAGGGGAVAVTLDDDTMRVVVHRLADNGDTDPSRAEATLTLCWRRDAAGPWQRCEAADQSRGLRCAAGGVRTFRLRRTISDRPFTRREATLVGVLIDQVLQLVDRPADLNGSAEDATLTRLTPRERDVLDRLRRGDSFKEAAARLGLSVHTVSDHAKQLHRKLGVTSRGELLARQLDREAAPASRGET